MKQGRQLERPLFKTYIGYEGYTVTEKLKNMGAEMKVLKETNDDLMKIYLKDPYKYNGVD